MERGSSKHGPRLDDEQKHETEGLVRGGGSTHAEEWKQPRFPPKSTSRTDLVRPATSPALPQGSPRPTSSGAATSPGGSATPGTPRIAAPC